MRKQHLITLKLRAERGRGRACVSPGPSLPSLQWGSFLTHTGTAGPVGCGWHRCWPSPVAHSDSLGPDGCCLYHPPTVSLAQRRPDPLGELALYSATHKSSKSALSLFISPGLWLLLHWKFLDSKVHRRKWEGLGPQFSAMFVTFPPWFFASS